MQLINDYLDDPNNYTMLHPSEIGCYVLCSDNCSVHRMPLDSFLDLYPLALYHVGAETVVVLKHQPVDRG